MKKILPLLLIPFCLLGCQNPPFTPVQPPRNTQATLQSRPTPPFPLSQQTQSTTQSLSQQTTHNISQQNLSADVLTLASGATLKIPQNWQVTPFKSTPETSFYLGKSPIGDFSITEINVNTWLKGQGPEDVGGIPYQKKPQAIQLLKNIYDQQKITNNDQKQFVELEGDFLGYVPQYRSAVTYIANNDNDYRGMTFYNQRGEGPGVGPVYYVVLYNPNKDNIIYGLYGINSNSKELLDVNADLNKVDHNKTSPEDIDKLDTVAQTKFKKLLESTPRQNLSFGTNVNAIDKFFKSMKSQ